MSAPFKWCGGFTPPDGEPGGEAGVKNAGLTLELKHTKTAVGGHHVPGTPYNWRHDWEPLNATTAAQHGKPWAGSKPSSSGGSKPSGGSQGPAAKPSAIPPSTAVAGAVSGEDLVRLIPAASSKKVGLDTSELQSVKWYARDGFRPINDQLRRAAGVNPSKYATQLDSAFDKVPPLSKPISVMRGIQGVAEIFGPVGSRVGGTFVDHALVSTSYGDHFTKTMKETLWYAKTPEALEEHGRKLVAERAKDGVAHVAIHVPAGTRALRVGDAANQSWKSEKEIILPRGQRFRVLSDRFNAEEGVRELELELIPGE